MIRRYGQGIRCMRFMRRVYAIRERGPAAHACEICSGRTKSWRVDGNSESNYNIQFRAQVYINLAGSVASALYREILR